MQKITSLPDVICSGACSGAILTHEPLTPTPNLPSHIFISLNPRHAQAMMQKITSLPDVICKGADGGIYIVDLSGVQNRMHRCVVPLLGCTVRVHGIPAQGGQPFEYPMCFTEPHARVRDSTPGGHREGAWDNQ